MTNNDIIFPYYSGNIKLTKVMGHVSLNKFIDVHAFPTGKTIELIKSIQNCKDSKEKRILKHNLYAFTPSVFIDRWRKRKYSSIQKYTGLMQIDLDGINDINISEDLKKWVFEQPECVCSYLSPSNNVKALIRINKPKTQDEYIRLHNAVTEKYESTGYFDSATKNAVLPLFLSVDSEILFRDYSQAIPWDIEKIIEIEHVSLNNKPQPNFNSTSQKYYYDKTIRILTNKINSISNNGHPQVRSAALILGSRVAANYINKQDAIIEITNLIKQNKYLSKGIQGYIDTSIWGINQGFNKPKYY